ncbi:class I SAM-dependent methyltransferase [Streptomyces lunaelactis]|uniref:class I SAM-dependent methyltransferase n=1 Tax=Streptomyces lunaelactis TaxID=1535768 RepID=UPI001584D6EC|nr:class I SAM-dependent methyltransferase [Streptomyces lunaelactis]NUK04785.1 class I SAM-dependent methyltransferase [Streptomyces lunaelactis]NUK20129.1 class I SAM-dependent methyltransferase [Streptomyces lunaelactis]NUK50645.1 class I SAM-dependent methyltransferase [Streptomyces lunaelactis]NUK64864.1 class I SAM-dependent methyltransferase [Streptomyces lunaelactis]NUK72640.1 class I SAM-dependent methyltransferase [Streptomyces lunaelactis]
MTDPSPAPAAASAAITDYWDAAASAFDDEPDHGLRADETRNAWAGLLHSWVPSGPLDVLDAGCGTGSLSLLLAEAGHRVTGVDLAPRMIDEARAKLTAAGLAARFLVGDAANPPTGDQRFDVLLSRHLVWTLPDPEAALREWVTRLRPGGRLVLIEGRWREAGQQGVPYVPEAESLPWNGGIGAEALAATVRPLVADVRVEPLSGNPHLWGGPVTDERYALIGRA